MGVLCAGRAAAGGRAGAARLPHQGGRAALCPERFPLLLPPVNQGAAPGHPHDASQAVRRVCPLRACHEALPGG